MSVQLRSPEDPEIAFGAYDFGPQQLNNDAAITRVLVTCCLRNILCYLLACYVETLNGERVSLHEVAATLMRSVFAAIVHLDGNVRWPRGATPGESV